MCYVNYYLVGLLHEVYRVNLRHCQNRASTICSIYDGDFMHNFFSRKIT